MSGFNNIQGDGGSKGDPLILHAIDVIEEEYGVKVSVDMKKKDLHKFGRNKSTSNSDPGSTVWTTTSDSDDNETYLDTNGITHFATDDISDTSMPITVEGHTISGSDLTFVTQNVVTDASDGRTKTALGTPLARINRTFVTGPDELAGNIYFAEDVTFTGGIPQTSAAIHLIQPSDSHNSRKASTSISSTDFWIITDYYGSVFEKTSSFADISLQTRVIGNVFREIVNIGVSSTGGLKTDSFVPYIIIPANSDIRLVATGSSDNLDVGGGINGFLAKVI